MADRQLTYDSDFGPKFQLHMLAVMIRVPTFALRYRSALSHEFFNDETHKVVAKALLIHIDEFKVIPVLATLVECCKPLTSAQTMPYVEALIDKLYDDDVSDYEAVQRRTIEWGKVQAMCVAVWEASKLIDDKKKDKVLARIQQAQLVGEDLLNLGIRYNATLEARANSYAEPEEMLNVIPSGIKHLDIAMGGGLSPGELGVVIAPPGRGKTTTLINIGFGAGIAGHDVLHYTLEMPGEKIAKRYDDRLMGNLVKTKNIDPERYGMLLKERGKKFLRGEKVIQRYYTRKASVSTFRAHLSLLAADGFRPSLIIVDYGDIVKAERRLGDMRHEQAGVYEDLRELAGEVNAVIWTGSQGNKESLEKDVITIKEFAESFEKAAIVDAAIGFCQSKDERQNSECRLFLGKLRNTEDGSTVSCNIYRDRCAIISTKLMDANSNVIADDTAVIGPDGEREMPPKTTLVTRVEKAKGPQRKTDRPSQKVSA